MMNPKSSSIDIDPFVFRRVLGHFPTGVAAITAIDEDGKPVGMAVGSFTSVSLDPPLVAFLPDKRSSTFPKIRAAGSFCVNVLASSQEPACRALASKAPDKFAELGWRPGPSGAPVLDDAVAWIDCEIDVIHEAGDHDIVIGRVNALEVANDSLPLIFFQGGYGKFSTEALTARPEPDLVEQLLLVDIAHPYMEQVATAAGVECIAVATVGEQLIIVGSAMQKGGMRVPTRVGERQPFAPPLAPAFVAWSEAGAAAWFARSLHPVGAEERAEYAHVFERIRERGWAFSLGSQTYERHRALATSFAAGASDDGLLDAKNVIDQLAFEYSQPELVAGEPYNIQTITVPVFGHDGDVLLLLTLDALPSPSSLDQMEHLAHLLQDAAAKVSTALVARRLG